MKRIGVLGGTFDPIHIGHLIVAERIRQQAGLDEVVFVPSGIPPHKDVAAVSSAEHRFMMTLLATLPHRGFSVSRVDLDRKGPSFTVDTLASLREELAPAELFFIMGSDSLAQLATWHEPTRLLRENRIIVAGRPGWDPREALEAVRRLDEKHCHHVEVLEVPGIGVSSREIRAMAGRGESVRYLVPDAVLDYIESYGLYRTPQS